MALRAEIERPNSEKLDDDIILMKPLWGGREVYAYVFGLYNLFYTYTLIKKFYDLHSDYLVIVDGLNYDFCLLYTSDAADE